MQEVLLAIMPPCQGGGPGPTRVCGYLLVVWVVVGPHWGQGCVPSMGSFRGCRTQPSKQCTEMGPHVGPGKSPPRGPSERVQAVGLPSCILTSRLCAQMMFLAWAGNMNSASEKNFHNSYQTALSLEGGR